MGERSTPPDIRADSLVPLVHLSYHLTMYKSKGLEGSFFASYFSVESSLLSSSTPKVFGERVVWRTLIAFYLLVGLSFEMLLISFVWIVCFALLTHVFQSLVDLRGLNYEWGFGMLLSP